MKKIMVLFLTILLLSGCGASEESITTTTNSTINADVEINSKFDMQSYLGDGEIIDEEGSYDISKLGKYSLKLKYQENGKEKDIIFNINVVDKQKPVIKYESELSTKVGKKIDLLKDVTVSDNSKEKLNVKVEGDYNFNKVGTYKLKYVAIDSSDNKAEENFILNVTDGKTSTKKTTTTSKKTTTTKTTTESPISEEDKKAAKDAFKEIVEKGNAPLSVSFDNSGASISQLILSSNSVNMTFTYKSNSKNEFTIFHGTDNYYICTGGASTFSLSSMSCKDGSKSISYNDFLNKEGDSIKYYNEFLGYAKNIYNEFKKTPYDFKYLTK